MRSRVDSPDTIADEQIREVLDRNELVGFTVVAGAGSGKTTSLVKALQHVVTTRGEELRARAQRIACVTYTETAAQEIHEDVRNSPLAAVSTIHSFLWSVVRPFQRDIKRWVESRISEKIAALEEKQAHYSSRTKQTTKDKEAAALAKLRGQQAALPHVPRFTYSVGSDYANGMLGHSDVLRMVPALILDRPLFAQLLASQFPFIFVDESQDTERSVVECLKHVAAHAQGRVCLGFFGDPMQRIYPTGAGVVPPEEGWAEITKPENFRSTDTVLALVNAVRAGGDDLVQEAPKRTGTEQQGEAYLFVLPADEERSANLESVRAWLDEHSELGNWSRSEIDGGSKVLMITHRMAARRLGFDGLWRAFDEHASQSLAEAFTEGTTWVLAPFRNVIEPICAPPIGRSAEVLGVLRAHSPMLGNNSTGADFKAALSAARDAVGELRGLTQSGATLRELLSSASASGLVDLDPRLGVFLDPEGLHRAVVLDDADRELLENALACTYVELAGYRDYVTKVSPYSTHHGTKGAEFDRVVVVVDDDEGAFPNISYGKLLGIEGLSETDQRNLANGTDSVLDRSRRLLYVCVSRARRGVAIVLFTADVPAALDVLKSGPLAHYVELREIDDLS